MPIPKPVVLIIMDGWGITSEAKGNAVAQAKTPNINRFWAAYPKTLLSASGKAVGLFGGEEGNSEAGHLNIGAGQIVFQELPKIDLLIADGSFFSIPAFLSAIKHVKKNKSQIHLIGLLGAGGVHSSISHLFALLKLAKTQQLTQVYLHLFTDGRDSPPSSALIYISQLQEEIEKIGIGKVASIGGRYFGMDRDHRWERTQKAYDAMVLGKGKKFKSAAEGIKASYQAGKTDEFIEPFLVTEDSQVHLINDHDSVIFFNFRIDRPRQLTKAFVLPDFERLVIEKVAFDPYAERYGLKQYQPPQKTTTFVREKVLQDLLFVTLTEYEPNLPVEVAFVPESVKMPLGRVIAEKDLRQFHIAETEKERHVTYYFNGRREKPFPGEDRVEIPSPNVKTYDLQPEMSAYGVTEELLRRIKTGFYDFILVNYANPDMVGHTGVFEAGIKACEVIDDCVGKVVQTVNNLDGVCLITADHGNVEEMIDLKTGEVDTKHSTNPVPFMVVSKYFDHQGRMLPRGVLADIAPTILAIMEVEKPGLMTGNNLLV
ncbi:2,3-bisphosphoglycerate-independent phosphoglycerate mutase [Patescibacteria group bacterium]|nr:2,3-bisphosphoglycerate-independent phosphoglycerate mutase [Patescibacteria group bacterium]